MGPRLQVEREIALHSRLRHRNIVAFHGHFADRDHVYMVLEYCSRQVPRGGWRGSLHRAPPPPMFVVLPSPTCVSLYLPVSAVSAPDASVLVHYAPVPTWARVTHFCTPGLTCVHLCPFIHLAHLFICGRVGPP